MLVVLNALKRLFALLCASLLLATGGLNTVFNGDIYPYASIDSVVGIETLTRSQGVTTDGESWIYSGKNALERVSLDNKEILALNTDAIPAELAEQYGAAHIGGISYANGYVYAPLEDSKVWDYPLVALYDAQTLAYTGIFFELSAEQHTRGVPWVIVDAAAGIAYAGDSSNPAQAFMYDLATFAYLGAFDFAEEISKIQGGECYDGKLYFGTNDSTRAVYTVDLATGEVTKLFDRILYEYRYIDNFGGEGEGLTVLPMDDGTLVHTLQLGVLFIDGTLRHYKLPTQ